MSSLKMRCPVYDDQKDDCCGREIQLDYWPEERMTHWYPGSPAGFDITSAPCGHLDKLEKEYYDQIHEEIGRMLLDAKISAEEYRAEARLERMWFNDVYSEEPIDSSSID